MGLFMMIFRWSKRSIARAGNIHLRLLGGQYVPRYSAGDEGRRGVILGKNLGTPAWTAPCTMETMESHGVLSHSHAK